MSRILITGGRGFVGRLLTRRLLSAGHALNVTGRGKGAVPDGNVRYFAVGEVGAGTCWREALEQCDTLIHLAAQVPLPGTPDHVYDEVNDRGTAQLVDQALSANVTHVILVSSVFAAVGNASHNPVCEATAPRPTSPYGRSKLAAEQHITRFTQSGRHGVVLRPPIVYGSTAQGNWRLLQRLAASGLPLPFAAVENRRTLIAGENLADAIAHLIALPPARRRSGIYMISDRETVSLKQILTWLREGMGLAPRLFPIPAGLLTAALRALGKGQMVDSLTGNLEIDSSHFARTFDWSPPVSSREAITRSGSEFLSQAGD